MKTFVLLALVAAVTVAKTLQDYPAHPFKQAEEVKALDLCPTCKTVFNLLKTQLKDAEKYDKEVLKPIVHNFCEKYGRFEKIKEVCEKISDEVLDKIAELLKEANGKIETEKICKAIHFCE